MLFLFSVLGAALAPSPITASTSVSVKTAVKATKESEGMDVEEDQVEEEEEAPMDDKMASTIGAIEAIFSLVRNTRIANRAYVSAAAVGLFVRLSCFGTGRTQLPVPVEVKTPKKKSKKEDSTASAAAGLSGLNKDIIAAIKLVEGSSDSSSSSGGNGNGHSHFHVPAEIAELAGSKLIALLADIGSVSISVLAVPAPVAASTDSKKWKGDKVLEKPLTDGTHSTTLIDLAVATVNYLSSTGGIPLLRTSEASEEDDEDDSEGGDALVALSSVVASMKSLCPATASSLSLLDGAGDSVKAQKGKAAAVSEAASDGTTDSDGSNISNEGAARKLRLRESFYSLLGHSLFHILTSSDVSMQALLDLATVSVRIVAESENESSSSSGSSSSSSGAIDIAASSKASKKAAKSGSDEDDDDDEDEEEERPQSILFDASMELLSVTGDHVVKGVRDAIKKVWNCLCQVRGRPLFLPSLLAPTSLLLLHSYPLPPSSPSLPSSPSFSLFSALVLLSCSFSHFCHQSRYFSLYCSLYCSSVYLLSFRTPLPLRIHPLDVQYKSSSHTISCSVCHL